MSITINNLWTFRNFGVVIYSLESRIYEKEKMKLSSCWMPWILPLVWTFVIGQEIFNREKMFENGFQNFSHQFCKMCDFLGLILLNTTVWRKENVMCIVKNMSILFWWPKDVERNTTLTSTHKCCVFDLPVTASMHDPCYSMLRKCLRGHENKS